MKTTRTDLVARAKRALKPLALSWLGCLPATAGLSGLGHILMFHRVIPRAELSPYGMAAFEITPQALQMILTFFVERGYRIISLDRMCDVLAGDPEAKRFIVLTFDDGYRDTLTHAYPVLKAHNAPFAVNITWNYAERRAIKWDYLAEEIIQENKTVTANLSHGRIELDCSTSEAKRKSCGVLQDALYELNRDGANDELLTFFKSFGKDVYQKTDELMLDWKGIEHLAQDPLVTVGAHSINHRVLSRLGESAARDEISLSKIRLEKRLAVEISHFAYPFGRLHEAGEREFDTVTQVGFRTGTTGMKGNIFKAHANRLSSLPRFCIGSDVGTNHLAAIANGTLPFLANRFHRLAG